MGPCREWSGGAVKHAKRDIECLREGCVVQVPCYLSTSQSADVAKHFAAPFNIKILLPATCSGARSVAEISFYQNEEEVLLAPYTTLKLLRKCESLLEYEVLPMKQDTPLLEIPSGPFADDTKFFRGIPVKPVAKESDVHKWLKF